MEQYDVLVVGSDIASLIGALFLARKLRSVAVILDPQEDDTSTDIMDITDPENNKYHFVYDRTAYLGGLSPTGLVGRYFQTIGLDKEIKAQAVLEDVLFTGEGDSRTRPNQCTNNPADNCPL